MKFDMKVHGIKIQPEFDFGACRSKVKGHSSCISKCGFRSITLVMFDEFLKNLV